MAVAPALGPGTKPWGLYLVADFCGLISIACLIPKWKAVAIRLIGASIFLVSIMYVIDQLGGPFYTNRSSPSLVNSVLFFLVFGLPSGYVMIFGIYPAWGKCAAAFREKDLKQEDLSDENEWNQ